MPNPPPKYPDDAWEALSPHMLESRRNKLLLTASQRTSHICLVMQDIHDPHNISACIRSAEAFGIQNIHVVARGEKFRASTVARGVHKWVTITQHQDPNSSAEFLKNAGYQLAAGYPASDAIELSQVSVEKPTAIIFGNEHEGVHPDWDSWVDIRFTIPMAGIVESFNISVAAAISMYDLTQRARGQLGKDYFLNLDQQKSLLNQWSCHQFRNWQAMVNRHRE